MAIAKMKKIRLVGVSYEKQLLLDALADTGAVQIRCTEENWQTAQEDATVFDVTEKTLRVSRAIDFIESVAQKNIKGYSSLKEPLSIKFDDFLTVMDNSAELESALAEIESLVAKQQENNRQLQKTRTFLSQVDAFSAVKTPFSAVENTKNTPSPSTKSHPDSRHISRYSWTRGLWILCAISRRSLLITSTA